MGLLDDFTNVFNDIKEEITDVVGEVKSVVSDAAAETSATAAELEASRKTIVNGTKATLADPDTAIKNFAQNKQEHLSNEAS